MRNHTTYLLRGGRILDPASGRDEPGDLLIADGLIQEAGAAIPSGCDVVDATGLVVVPGLWDLHVHFREPGNDEAETIASGSASAARGGFTTVVTMPNTRPPTDIPERVLDTIRKAEEAGKVRLLPSACVSAGRKGEALADLPALAAAGASTFTDDGSMISGTALLEQAMLASLPLRRTIMDHALDPVLSGDGVMHLGERSNQLGLPGVPSEAEDAVVARNIAASERTRCPMHIQHLSSRGSVPLLQQARSKGIPVTSEVTPHHLALTDADIPSAASTEYKMSPPLRSRADRTALVDAVAEGIIDAFATDHAPHCAAQKAKGFLAAPNGVVGLETAIGVTYGVLVRSGRMPLLEWLRRWTVGPAAVLGLPAPSFAPGSRADIALLDLSARWTVRAADFASRSRNTPFEGRELIGRSVMTFCGGRLTWNGRG